MTGASGVVDDLEKAFSLDVKCARPNTIRLKELPRSC